MYRYFIFVLLVISASSTTWAGVGNRLNPTADWALINAKVYTMDKKHPHAEAIAIEDDKIVYVGDAKGLKNYIGLGTKVYDLKGKMVLPGFIDAHTHLVGGAFVNSGVNLLTDDTDEIWNRLRKYVKEHKDDKFIIGYGLRRGPWKGKLPTAAMVDKIESKRPVYIWAVDGHAALANSKALEVAGVDKNTPDTVPGFSFFHRYPDGTPTGWLEEPPAQMQVFGPVVNPGPEFIRNNMLQWLPRIAAAGVTTAHDYGVQGMGQVEGYQMYTDLAKEGLMPLRVSGVFYWNDPSIDPLPPLREMREKFKGQIAVRYLKINMDGADDAWSGVYIEPYNDKPDIKPKLIIPREVLFKVVREADKEGIDTTCHCWGDGAVRTYLDAVENAIKHNPIRDRRMILSHGSNVHPDDIDRFAKLGVTYDTSGAWLANDPTLVEISRVRLGYERQQDMYPVMKIHRAGGRVSFGSDWPVSGYLSEYRPLMMIRTAVNGKLPGLDDRPPLGGEKAKVPLQLALEASTINPAYAMGYDKMIGSLEVGKEADVVILEKDLFDVDPKDIHKVRVLMTIMDGKLTYEAENSDIPYK